MSDQKDVVICGAGVIGASLAYHLSLRGMTCTVIERERVAYGASGTAAGLLSPVAPADAETPAGKLLALSMSRHRQLVEELDGRRTYDYAEVLSHAVAMSEAEAELLSGAHGRECVGKGSRVGNWLDRDHCGAVEVEGGAQLDPGKLTQALLDAACAKGSEVVSGDVQGIRTDGERITGVLVSAETIEASRVVVAMGPWSPEAEGWLRLPLPVTPLKGQILQYRIDGAPDGLFSSLDGNYAVRKPTGIVYAGTTEEDAGFDLGVTREARTEIEDWARGLSSIFEGQEPFAQTACLRPLSADGLPLMGAVGNIDGAYVATGHGRKGIMLSAGTGVALAELIATGASSALDLAPFDPGRFRGTPGGNS